MNRIQMAMEVNHLAGKTDGFLKARASAIDLLKRMNEAKKKSGFLVSYFTKLILINCKL